ncbi:hypothetical protein SG34_025875 [Thalassomonas viridans]|uniref:Methyltransferase domain-containing protein n=1 Tax=Thalassomonas viridans TaxID=137584 RepID=A0AAE9Z291_9GAMM|nr:hypothetical protein [Thalassomonas viridans]WDE04715.1 hypothetical protein SG34_025875 [Thalassomonas viridans]
MRLPTQFQQEKLLYFNQGQEAISVYENSYYRWLNFSGILQSLMLKSRPWQLTLPHHNTLLLPLLFYRPKQVIELGLGGGNLLRFLKKVMPAIDLISIEYQQSVIDCFQHYFNPEDRSSILIHADIRHWFHHHSPGGNNWIIYDIYQQQEVPDNNRNILLQLLAKTLTPDSCFSINLPEPSSPELALLLQELRVWLPSHRVYYFTVSRYRNIIIHLLPLACTPDKPAPLSTSYLPPKLIPPWLKCWQAGKVL